MGKARKRGSVIVMVTFAILVLFALIGLVVDIGWAFFTRRAAQVAADAAVQAGANKALEMVGAGSSNFSQLGPNNAVVLAHAKRYADLNGFPEAEVVVTSGPGPYPDDPNLALLRILYWVRASVTRRLPSLFIRMAGAGEALTSGAFAVGAVVLGPATGSIYLLNRTCEVQEGVPPDCSNPNVVYMGGKPWKGLDLHVQGSATVTTNGGIFVNSSANGDARTAGGYAVEIEGNTAFVKSAFMQIAQDGSFRGAPDPDSLPKILGLDGLPQAPSNGPQVKDPTQDLNFGKQPRVRTVEDLTNFGLLPVYGATAPFSDATNLPPGVYVSIMNTVTGWQLTGEPIKITGPTTFAGGDYIFLGGVDIGGAEVNFGNGGVFTIAGVKPTPNGSAGTAFTIAENAKVIDNGAVSSNKGELFLLTRPDYGVADGYPTLLDPTKSYTIQPLTAAGGAFGGAVVRPFAPLGTPATGGLLDYGNAELKAGATDKANVNLHGVRGARTCDPGSCPSPSMEELISVYQPMFLWQDRQTRPHQTKNDPGLIHAHAGLLQGTDGIFYQKRGSLFELQAAPNSVIQAKLITGALDVQGSGNLDLPPLSNPLLITIVALVR